MDDREADERYNRLVADLGTLQKWLEDRGESQWAEWLGSSRQQIIAQDGNGLSHLLRAYGGMGSFNDLQISRAMGRLRTRMYVDATALLTDLER
jgi:hypothetical protein